MEGTTVGDPEGISVLRSTDGDVVGEFEGEKVLVVGSNVGDLDGEGLEGLSVGAPVVDGKPEGAKVGRKLGNLVKLGAKEGAVEFSPSPGPTIAEEPLRSLVTTTVVGTTTNDIPQISSNIHKAMPRHLGLRLRDIVGSASSDVSILSKGGVSLPGFQIPVKATAICRIFLRPFGGEFCPSTSGRGGVVTS